MVETNRLFGLSVSELRLELEKARLRRLELVLEAHAAMARRELSLEEVLEAFDCSRSAYYRLLKIARYRVDGYAGDGRSAPLLVRRKPTPGL